MSLSTDDVRHVAKLARIFLNEEETISTISELNSIFALVDQMEKVDTDSVAPISHPLDLVQTLRADVVTETNQRDFYQKIAPQSDSGFYLVPKVIE